MVYEGSVRSVLMSGDVRSKAPLLLAPTLHCPWALLWQHDSVQTAFHSYQNTVTLNTAWTSVTMFALCRDEQCPRGFTQRVYFCSGWSRFCNSSHIPVLGTREAVPPPALKGNIPGQHCCRMTNNTGSVESTGLSTETIDGCGGEKRCFSSYDPSIKSPGVLVQLAETVINTYQLRPHGDLIFPIRPGKHVWREESCPACKLLLQ